MLELQGRAGNRSVGTAFGGSASLQVLHRLMGRLHPELAPFLADVLEARAGAPSPAAKEANPVIDEIEEQLDSMGEMEEVRLQMAMDRMSKLMSTLSNIMKKQSETRSAIIGNLK